MVRQALETRFRERAQRSLHQMSSIFSITPPKKITRGNYICDSKFHIDALIPLFSEHPYYGVVLIDGAGFKLYKMNDHECDQVNSSHVTQMNHHRRGGQSSARIGRLRENKKDRIVDFISEEIYESFWNKEDNVSTIKGIIIAGSGNLKEEVLKDSLFKKYFGNLIVSNQSISTLNDGTVHRVYTESKESIYKSEHDSEKQIFDEFLKIQEISPHLLKYGINETKEAISEDMIKKVIISSSLEDGIKALIKDRKYIHVVILYKYTDLIDNNYGGCVSITF